jgi:hypothetical protein
VGAGEGLLGAGEVADAPADLAGLVEGPGGDPRVEPHLPGGPGGLRLRLRPGAPQAGRLGPVDPADGRERGVRRQRVAPLPGRLVPLAEPPDVADLQAGGDDVAVHDAGEEGAKLAGDDRGHRLVEQRHPVGDPAGVDQRQPLGVDAHGGQVRVAEAQADLGGPLGAGHRLLALAAGQGHGGLDPRQVAVLDALGLVAQQPLRPHQPAGGQCRLAPEEVLQAQPARAPGRPRDLPGGHVAGVGPLPVGDRLVRPGQPPGGVGKPLQVAWFHAGRVEGAQLLVRLGPGLPAERAPGAVGVGDPPGQEPSLRWLASQTG